MAASAAQGEPGLRAVVAAGCARTLFSPGLRANLALTFGVPEDDAQLEWCRRLDRAIAKGRISGAQLAKVIAGDYSETFEMGLALIAPGMIAAPSAPPRPSQPDASMAADAESAERFFQAYIASVREYDPRIADLYADEAKLIIYQRSPRGVEKLAEMGGKIQVAAAYTASDGSSKR